MWNVRIQKYNTLSIEVNLEKIKILTMSDHPLSPSGVGMQTRYMIESMLKTGKYQFISLGGAIKHDNYEPVRMEDYGEDWTIFPVDGYGNQEMIRSIIRNEKPDIMWIMTDPRFWMFLWEIENEVRPLMPIVYYHVWDNKPYPLYNKKYYESNKSKINEKFICSICFGKYTHCNKAEHCKSKKHNNALENKSIYSSSSSSSSESESNSK